MPWKHREVGPLEEWWESTRAYRLWARFALAVHVFRGLPTIAHAEFRGCGIRILGGRKTMIVNCTVIDAHGFGIEILDPEDYAVAPGGDT